ncbi:PPP4R2-domain-containing protein [Haematococcus lacustris]
MSLTDQPMGVEPSTVATSPDPDFVGATPQAEHSHERIASELDLERFSTLPIEQRQLTEPLRGVLAETALSGVIRYNWTLLRPLVEFGLSQVLEEYEARAAAEGAGPTRPAFPGESLACTQARFRRCLHRFARAPWTLQRLCELLLAPRTQYLKLHKVALAIEKCLMVTSEVPTLPDPPPPPALADLGAVNVNPPPVQSKDSGPRPAHSPPASPTAAGAGAASSPTKAGQMDCSNNDQLLLPPLRQC